MRNEIENGMRKFKLNEKMNEISENAMRKYLKQNEKTLF